MSNKLKLRPWQSYVIDDFVEKGEKGLFVQALGGYGKTIMSLAMAERLGAKRVLVVNNSLAILSGWVDSHAQLEVGYQLVTTTQKSLPKVIKDNPSFDVMIVDEWQNGSSDSYCKLYKKIKRKYSIALSATPVRQKGQNMFNLERFLWGKANPNQKFNWQLAHGNMVFDRFSYSKQKWESFRDYETYRSGLPAFYDSEMIAEIEGREENNGYKTEFIPVPYKPANPVALKTLSELNIVADHEKETLTIPIGSFAVFGTRKKLAMTKNYIKDGKLQPTDLDTDFLIKTKSKAESLDDCLIVTESVDRAKILYQRIRGAGLLTGDYKANESSRYLVATTSKIGVGVDGLQDRFSNMIVCEPVAEDSGAYDDYRQLLWRITGSRQKQDVKIFEMTLES